MPKLSERGFIAHFFLLLLLGAGLIAGVYLVTSGNPLKLFSKASMSKPVGPETSFTLTGPGDCSGFACFLPGRPQPKEEFAVALYARSDIEGANLFEAKMTFPKNLVEVKEIQTENSFVQNWVENFYDNDTGEIALAGGVTAPGYQTQTGGESGLMATIVFKAKEIGKGTLSLTDSSTIYSNLNNINILTVKRNYEISVEVPPPSPTPVATKSFGNALYFDRNKQTPSVKVLKTHTIGKFDAVTMEAWVRLKENPNIRYSYPIFYKQFVGGTKGDVFAYLLDITPQGKLKFTYSMLYQGRWAPTEIKSNEVIPFDQWTHVAVLYHTGQPKGPAGFFESDEMLNKVALYINGKRVATQEQEGPIGGGSETSYGDDVIIGDSGLDNFSGLIDEVRISNALQYLGPSFNVPTVPFLLNPNTPGGVASTSVLLLCQFDENGGSPECKNGSGSTFNTKVYNVTLVASTIPTGMPLPSPSPSPATFCDVNGDGAKDLKDGELVTNCWTKPATGECAKVETNGDGKITNIDIQKFSYNCPDIFLSASPSPSGQKGDGNKDAKINLIDMSIIHTDWMKKAEQSNFRAGIDMNSDGLINTFDFGLHRNLLLSLGVIKTR